MLRHASMVKCALSERTAELPFLPCTRLVEYLPTAQLLADRAMKEAADCFGPHRPRWVRADVAMESDRVRFSSISRRQAVGDLLAIARARVISPRWTFLRIASEIYVSNVMADADFNTAQAAEELRSSVSTRAVEAICLLVIDSRDLETLMKVVQRRRFVGVYDCPFVMRAIINDAAWLSVPETIPQTARTSLLMPRKQSETRVLGFVFNDNQVGMLATDALKPALFEA